MLGPVVLDVSGWVVGDVQLVPSKILLPPAPVGSLLREMVCLRSRSGKSFAVERVDCDSKDVRVESVDDASADRHTFHVIQRVSAVGRNCSVIRFLIRSGHETAEEYTLMVLACGVLP